MTTNGATQNTSIDTEADPWAELCTSPNSSQSETNENRSASSAPAPPPGGVLRQISPGMSVVAFESSEAYLAHLRRRLAKLQERREPAVRSESKLEKLNHFVSMIGKSMDEIEIEDPFERPTEYTDLGGEDTADDGMKSSIVTSSGAEAIQVNGAQLAQNPEEAMRIPLLSEVEAALRRAALSNGVNNETKVTDSGPVSASQVAASISESPHLTNQVGSSVSSTSGAERDDVQRSQSTNQLLNLAAGSAQSQSSSQSVKATGPVPNVHRDAKQLDTIQVDCDSAVDPDGIPTRGPDSKRSGFSLSFGKKDKAVNPTEQELPPPQDG